MKTLRLLAIAAAVSASGAAFAADQTVVTDEGVGTFSFFKPASVRAEIGTTGYGGAIGWSINPSYGVSLGYNGGELNYETDSLPKSNSDGKITLKGDFDNTYLTGTWRPWKGNFGVDIGVVYNKNALSAEVAPDGTNLQLDGSNFTGLTSADLITVKASLRSPLSPFVGISYSPAITDRFGLFTQLGAYWQNKPVVNWSASAATMAKLDTTGTRSVGNAMAAEQIKMNQDLDDANDFYGFYPVAKVGLQVRF